jgi:hypothetical protein
MTAPKNDTTKKLDDDESKSDTWSGAKIGAAAVGSAAVVAALLFANRSRERAKEEAKKKLVRDDD